MITLSSSAFGQASSTEKTLAERLGYPRDAKLLIVHGDDLAMAHSIDAASIKALETGSVSSASIMIPCPWLPEIAAYARSHPDADLGLHLTLTSEWTFYRWGPVLSKDRVPSLLNRDGYLYPTEVEAAAHIDPREAEAEVRAQIERAHAFGIQPTHLDSHMGTLYENHLPVRVSKDFFAQAAFLPEILQPGDVVIDHIVSIDPSVPPERWAEYYANAIKTLQPGVTEFVIHLAYDDDEMRGATADHPDWGAAWRKRDFDFFTSEACRKLLEENGVKLITWREIGKLLAKPAM
jgi:hypothetical protein